MFRRYHGPWSCFGTYRRRRNPLGKGTGETYSNLFSYSYRTEISKFGTVLRIGEAFRVSPFTGKSGATNEATPTAGRSDAIPIANGFIQRIHAASRQNSGH